VTRHQPSRMKRVRRKRKTEEILPPYERKPERPLPHKFYVMERRKQATLLRVAGLSNTEIGLQLHADPAVNSKSESYMGGYGWLKWVRGEHPLIGRSLAAAVSTDLSAHFQWAESSFAESQDLLRQLDLARLDTLQRAIWQRASGGDDWAIDRALAIIDRRMKLMGLEMRSVEINAHLNATVEHHDRIPAVDAAYAQAMLEGLAELSAGRDDDVIDSKAVVDDDVTDAEVIDVEPIDP
jgi:hypothetical protein